MIDFDLTKFAKQLDSEKTATILIGKTAQIVVDICDNEYYKIQYSKTIDGKYFYHVLDVQKSLWQTFYFIRGFIAAVNYM